MEHSDKLDPTLGPNRYNFETQSKFLRILLGRLNLGDEIVAVVHEVGSMFGFAWANRNRDRIQADGLKASDQALAALTPYQTEHINRFGNYMVNFSRTPEPLPPNLRQSEGQPLVDHIG